MPVQGACLDRVGVRPLLEGALMLGKLKKVLGVLTDLLNIGRSKGWWQKGPGPK